MAGARFPSQDFNLKNLVLRNMRLLFVEGKYSSSEVNQIKAHLKRMQDRRGSNPSLDELCEIETLALLLKFYESKRPRKHESQKFVYREDVETEATFTPNENPNDLLVPVMTEAESNALEKFYASVNPTNSKSQLSKLNANTPQDNDSQSSSSEAIEDTSKKASWNILFNSIREHSYPSHFYVCLLQKYLIKSRNLDDFQRKLLYTINTSTVIINEAHHYLSKEIYDALALITLFSTNLSRITQDPLFTNLPFKSKAEVSQTLEKVISRLELPEHIVDFFDTKIPPRFMDKIHFVAGITSLHKKVVALNPRFTFVYYPSLPISFSYINKEGTIPLAQFFSDNLPLLLVSKPQPSERLEVMQALQTHIKTRLSEKSKIELAKELLAYESTRSQSQRTIRRKEFIFFIFNTVLSDIHDFDYLVKTLAVRKINNKKEINPFLYLDLADIYLAARTSTQRSTLTDLIHRIGVRRSSLNRLTIPSIYTFQPAHSLQLLFDLFLKKSPDLKLAICEVEALSGGLENQFEDYESRTSYSQEELRQQYFAGLITKFFNRLIHPFISFESLTPKEKIDNFESKLDYFLQVMDFLMFLNKYSCIVNEKMLTDFPKLVTDAANILVEHLAKTDAAEALEFVRRLMRHSLFKGQLFTPIFVDSPPEYDGIAEYVNIRVQAAKPTVAEDLDLTAEHSQAHETYVSTIEMNETVQDVSEEDETALEGFNLAARSLAESTAVEISSTPLVRKESDSLFSSVVSLNLGLSIFGGVTTKPTAAPTQASSSVNSNRSMSSTGGSIQPSGNHPTKAKKSMAGKFRDLFTTSEDKAKAKQQEVERLESTLHPL